MDVKEELEKKAKTAGIASMEAEEKGAGKESGSSPKSGEKMALIREDTVPAEKSLLPNAVQIRLLTADEIECRVSTVNEKGVSLLLYKDARVDQKILDETFTPFGWRRTHQSIDGNLYCTVEI